MVRSVGDAERVAASPASVVAVDFDDESALGAALAGVPRAYLVTPSSERTEAQRIRFAELGEHLVVLSQLGAASDPPARFSRSHAAVEKRVQQLAIPHTFLRPNLYFQGLSASPPASPPRAAPGRQSATLR